MSNMRMVVHNDCRYMSSLAQLPLHEGNLKQSASFVGRAIAPEMCGGFLHDLCVLLWCKFLTLTMEPHYEFA